MVLDLELVGMRLQDGERLRIGSQPAAGDEDRRLGPRLKQGVEYSLVGPAGTGVECQRDGADARIGLRDGQAGLEFGRSRGQAHCDHKRKGGEREGDASHVGELTSASGI
ncbi:hypothetical protein GCM10008179_30500 [Hansschlegelia plantiphila]|uniref:Uncharacterized protein n=1 Tax=Hansschlegelia plantiphila TaxID=374655 RepID=A0A9W6J313_9HYPH|nr:hypothetical protein GCM10008179_30500 [Hansschlegelia plantiphila]